MSSSNPALPWTWRDSGGGRPPAALGFLPGLALVCMLLSGTARAGATAADDRRALAALDVRYQRAVLENDTKTMAQILADDFVLVEGDGKRSNRRDLLESARSGKTRYERQEDTERSVIVAGAVGIVTAKLWFSDVYVRTTTGWRYVFGQASLPLPGKVH